jgi:hypothetical protein
MQKQKGLDEYGEAFLVLQPREEALGRSLLAGPLPPLQSAVSPDSLTGVVLDALCLGVRDVPVYVGRTLYGYSLGAEAVSVPLRAALQHLDELKFVRPVPESGHLLEPTPLGRASFRALLPPPAAVKLHALLVRAQRALCVTDELHVCAICAPLQPSTAIDWARYDAACEWLWKH